MLPLTRPSEHAIRALTHLANHPREKRFLTRELADELDIPAPFLAKVLHPLIQRGILTSQRGRNGGVQLAQEPADVSLYEVVGCLEHLEGLRPCFLGQAECSDARACPMHEFWKRSWSGYFELLRGTTLQSLVGFCRRAPASGYPGRVDRRAG